MGFFGFLFQRFDPGELGKLGELRYLDFLVPGICAMTVLFGASQSGIGWIRDFQTGFLARLLGTPSSPGSLLGGKILADVLRLLAQATAVLALALLLGARLHFGPALLPGVLGLLLFATAFSSLSCAIALRARAQEAMAAFVHVVNMPLLFTSTALVPSRQMPDWLSGLARWNPLSHAVDGLRGALLHGQAPDVRSLALLALVALALYLVAAREMGRLQRGGRRNLEPSKINHQLPGK
jgi:ABC-2 type transport system permease protein